MAFPGNTTLRSSGLPGRIKLYLSSAPFSQLQAAKLAWLTCSFGGEADLRAKRQPWAVDKDGARETVSQGEGNRDCWGERP